MQADSFYRDFEDRYRGSREIIKARLSVYLPFIVPLKEIYDECLALDLGCGRGEWLELLENSGFKARGVDLDSGMLDACRERGLSVDQQDVIEALRHTEDESQVVISGFHIAEHIPFHTLQELVKEALRTLKPAGLLILETPNPENIIVGTTNFYLDPTHQRPLPPGLLSFLPEHSGFFRTKILRLQENKNLVSANDINLLQVLAGVSPDYCVIAQKNATADRTQKFDSSFEMEYGLTLDHLVQKYDSGIQQKIEKLGNKLALIEAQSQENLRLADQLAQLNAALSSALIEQRDLGHQVQHWRYQAQQAQAALNEQVHQMHAVYASRSWRLTYALRWYNLQQRLLRQYGVAARGKALFKKIVRLIARGVRAPGTAALPQQAGGAASRGLAAKLNQSVRAPVVAVIKWAGDHARRSPRFKRFAMRMLRKYPGLQHKLHRAYLEPRLANPPPPDDRPNPATGDLTTLYGPIPDDRAYAMSSSDPDGINAGQRSPLESNFQNYLRRL